MSEKPIKRIPRETVEKQREETRRTELAMLKLLSAKYPSEAAKFAKSVTQNLSLTNALC